MRIEYQYRNEEERSDLIKANSEKYLIEERNITEGNFLVFSDMSLEEETLIKNNVVEKIKALETENKLLKAQNNATSERADFIEDVLAEIAMQVYQ